MRGPLGLVLACVLAMAGPASARTLIINANTSDPAPRAAWEAVVADFRRDNPGVEVKFNLYDHESYKKSIRNWLTGASPDVVFWFAGNRMREFVGRNLLTDVSGLFDDEVRASISRAGIDLVSVEGRQYGVPYSYYQLGLYFRRDLLERAGVKQAPATWADLIETCRALKADGVEPFAIGSKDLWPTAAWFDYINLRSNGHAFHMALTRGEVPYTDTRVRAVFAKWGELLELGCFAKNHASLSWQESQALLYQGRAAMMLIGNYIVANFPSEVRERMDFAPFPAMQHAAGKHEEAPTNSIHIPAAARNKEDARRFLAYVLRADVQERINRALLLLPAQPEGRHRRRPLPQEGSGAAVQCGGPFAILRPRHQRGTRDHRHEGLSGIHDQSGTARPGARGHRAGEETHLQELSAIIRGSR